MPKLTCITTTHNEGVALLPSVNSVLSQSFRDFQYIIVDDGSSSETVKVLDNLEDPRIQVIRQANGGLSNARNAALEHAIGDYVCFLDADDLRPNWSFDAINQSIENTSPDLLLCPGVLQDLRGEITDFYDAQIFEKIAEMIPSRRVSRIESHFSAVCTIAQQIEPQSANKIVRREFLQNSGIKFPHTFFFEDIFFHTNIIAASDSISFLDCPAFTYFRRYQRPQITSTAGDLRFDIIAVSKITLETFALRPEFHDPGHRAAVFATCLKIVEWCERSISLHYRGAYRQSARALIQLIDPIYQHLPVNLPIEAGNLDRARRYLEALMSAV